MREYQRAQRVAPLIQQVVAKLLQEHMEDPSFNELTVTHVDVSPDLSFAKIYVTIHDEAKKKEIIKKLNDQKKYFRYQITQSVVLKKSPDIRFYYDQQLEDSNHLFDLLNQVD